MHHLLAWFISIGQTVDTDVTTVADPVITVQNAHFLPQTDVRLLWAAAMSATLNRVRFATPKTRGVTNPWVRPLIEAAIPPSNPGVMTRVDDPFVFRALEEIQLLATSGLAMGNENFTALAMISTGFVPIPQGDIYPLRFTSTTAATANKWSQLTVTFQDTLPSGTYAIVGLEVESANAQAARLILQNQQYRPGTLSVTALANRQHSIFYERKLGVLGTFQQTAMPLIEVLANGADASHEGYLDVIRIG